MIVVKGHDGAFKEFITNDPGTRYGNDYRYAESVLDEALRDCKSGYHEPVSEINKVMIVVEK